MAARKSIPPTEIPDAVFHAIAFLLPGLNQVAQECGISIGEWIIMWHLSQVGIASDGAHSTMLRQDLTQLLARRGFGDANITRVLNSLEDKDLVRRVSLTHRERDRLFGSTDGGNRLAVVLQGSGAEKIQEFKKRLLVHFEQWRSERMSMTLAASSSESSVARQFTEWFFKGFV